MSCQDETELIPPAESLKMSTWDTSNPNAKDGRMCLQYELPYPQTEAKIPGARIKELFCPDPNTYSYIPYPHSGRYRYISISYEAFHSIKST